MTFLISPQLLAVAGDRSQSTVRHLRLSFPWCGLSSEPNPPAAEPAFVSVVCQSAVFSSSCVRSSFGIVLRDTALTPRRNIERICDLKLPQRPAASTADFGLECGICYSYKLGQVRSSMLALPFGCVQCPSPTRLQTIPEYVCDNPKCARTFHVSCLYEWLKALRTTRQSFNSLFGNCPYCSHPCTVTAPTT